MFCIDVYLVSIHAQVQLYYDTGSVWFSNNLSLNVEMEVYLRFKEKYLNVKIGIRAFHKLKTFFVCHQNHYRNVCQCVKHVQMQLLIDVLVSARPRTMQTFTVIILWNSIRYLKLARVIWFSSTEVSDEWLL